MKQVLVNFKTLAFLVPFVLTTTQLAKADTVTDTGLNVTYTATSNFAPGPGNTYNVFLNINPTGFSAGSGFLTAVVLQFKTGSDISSAVTLAAAPGGVSAWSTEMVGGANSGGCNNSGGSSGSVCFQNISANTVVPGGPYNFQFVVTMPGTDALTAASDVKAVYNSLLNNSGKNLGITSMGITIQRTAVPEPITSGLVGTGLISLFFLRRRITGKA
jgi:PEP-CTERM motif